MKDTIRKAFHRPHSIRIPRTTHRHCCGISARSWWWLDQPGGKLQAASVVWSVSFFVCRRRRCWIRRWRKKTSTPSWMVIRGRRSAGLLNSDGTDGTCVMESMECVAICKFAWGHWASRLHGSTFLLCRSEGAETPTCHWRGDCCPLVDMPVKSPLFEYIWNYLNMLQCLKLMVYIRCLLHVWFGMWNGPRPSK